MAELELSVVIPALNEERTIVHCIDKAKKAIAALGVPGEVLIADNGSTDRTRAVAEAAGARVVAVDGKGYGRALRGGFTAAKGRYLIMGDADGSYDFEQIPATSSGFARAATSWSATASRARTRKAPCPS